MYRRWKRYQEVLEAKRSEVIKELCRRRSQLSLETGGDLLDRLGSLTERELAVRTLDRLSRLLAELNAALERIRVGSFGTCQECGGPIGPRRLAAVPWSALCIECQQAADRREPEAA